jgi:predicted nucleic acid-binding protein
MALFLPDIPAGSNVFVDANVLVYGLTGQSQQCRNFLERCSREELFGISSFSVLAETTHRFMVAEAQAKGFIAAQRGASALKSAFLSIGQLVDYWQNTLRILNLNLLMVTISETVSRQAQIERDASYLLTNDSLIVSCMRDLGVNMLASRDSDFDRVLGLQVFAPNDL